MWRTMDRMWTIFIVGLLSWASLVYGKKVTVPSSPPPREFSHCTLSVEGVYSNFFLPNEEAIGTWQQIHDDGYPGTLKLVADFTDNKYKGWASFEFKEDDIVVAVAVGNVTNGCPVDGISIYEPSNADEMVGSMHIMGKPVYASCRPRTGKVVISSADPDGTILGQADSLNDCIRAARDENHATTAAEYDPINHDCKYWTAPAVYLVDDRDNQSVKRSCVNEDNIFYGKASSLDGQDGWNKDITEECFDTAQQCIAFIRSVPDLVYDGFYYHKKGDNCKCYSLKGMNRIVYSKRNNNVFQSGWLAPVIGERCDRSRVRLDLMYIQEKSAMYCGATCDHLFTNSEEIDVMTQKSTLLLPGLGQSTITEESGIFKVLNDMRKEVSEMNVSYMEFTDKNVPDLGDWNDKCYQYVSPLKSYDTEFKSILKQHFVDTWGVDSVGPASGRDMSENQLDAIIKSAKFSFKDEVENEDHVIRIMLLVTDKNYHTAGDAEKNIVRCEDDAKEGNVDECTKNYGQMEWTEYDDEAATLYNDESCLTQEYPRVELASARLLKNKIKSLIYLGSSDDVVRSSWAKLVGTEGQIVHAREKVRSDVSDVEGSIPLFANMAYKFDADDLMKGFYHLFLPLCSAMATTTTTAQNEP